MARDDVQNLTPEEMLCFDAYALSQAFGRFYKPLLMPLDLTYPQYLVMSVLWDEAPTSVGRIGKRLGLETSTLTPLIKRLESAGLVTRMRDETDERRVLVTPTAKGRSLSQEAGQIPDCVMRASGLSPDEVDELRGKLRDLRTALLTSGDGALS